MADLVAGGALSPRTVATFELRKVIFDDALAELEAILKPVPEVPSAKPPL